MVRSTISRTLACIVAFAAVVLGVRAAHAQPPQDPADQALLRLARVEDPRSLGIGRVIPDVEFTTLRGEKRTLSAELKDRKGIVIAMVGATCPLSIEYSPRLAELESQWAARGIGIVFVNAVEAETTIDMEDQVKKYRFRGPYAPDRDRALCKALGVRTTTETFLLDASRTLIYRGAVDDQYAIGGSIPAPRHSFLIDAVDAFLESGGRPRIRATSAPGCLVSCADPASKANAGPTTYNGKVAWIIRENCAACHRPGGAAPFTLDTYEAVSGRAKMIEAVLRDGLMPPWHGSAHPAGEPSPWVNDRSLATEDRDALLAWLASNRPRGSETSPPPLAPLSRTWSIGEPDHLATTSGFRLPAQGGLQHARVMVGFSTTEDKWVSALELRPVESNSVHHALVWILEPGTPLPQPGDMPVGLQLFATYSPGDSVLRYPAGAARRIRAGSIFLVDLYARPAGKEMISALRIGLKWGANPTWQIRSLTAGAAKLENGAGPDELIAAASLPLPPRARVLALTPYLRAGGRGFTIDAAVHGVSQNVLSAPAWDMRWQIRYEFIEPRELEGPLMIHGRYKLLADRDTPVVMGSDATDEALLLSADVLEPVAPLKKGN